MIKASFWILTILFLLCISTSAFTFSSQSPGPTVLPSPSSIESLETRVKALEDIVDIQGKTIHEMLMILSALIDPTEAHKQQGAYRPIQWVQGKPITGGRGSHDPTL